MICLRTIVQRSSKVEAQCEKMLDRVSQEQHRESSVKKSGVETNRKLLVCYLKQQNDQTILLSCKIAALSETINQ